MTNTRTSTWNSIGTDLNTTDFSTVLKDAHLDYTVKCQDVTTEINGEQIVIPGRKAIVRDDGHIYGVLSKNYTPIQNQTAFEFINDIDEDIKFVKAGETYNGLIYIIGELNKVNILGDEFIPHVIFRNSHNGGYSLATSICPLRVVCQNQFNLAFKESNSTFIIKHTINAENKMAIASDALKNISHYMKVFNEKAELFATQKIDEAKVTKFINFMFPINEEMTPKAIEQAEEQKTRFIKAYQSDDNLNFRGTAWGLINGLTDYITHKTYKRKVENADEKRFIDTICIGDKLNESMDFIKALSVA